MASRIAFKRRERKKRIAFIGTIKFKSGQTLKLKLNQKIPKADRHLFLPRSWSALFQRQGISG